MLLKLAQAKVSLGLSGEALSELLNLKKEFGNSLAIQMNLITTYSITKDYDCLIGVAEKVIKETPNILFVWTALISALQSQNNYFEAINRSTFPLLRWPLSENINNLVAKSYFQLDEYLKSLKYYEKILKIKPENRASLRGKLFILSNLGRKNYTGKIELSKKEYLDQATELAEKLVIIDSHNFEVWLSKSVIEKELGNYPGALVSVRQAKLLEVEGYRSELMEARLLIRQKRNSDAIKILTKLKKTNNHEPQIHFNLAIALTSKFLEKRILPILPELYRKINKSFLRSMKLDPFNLFFLEEYIKFLDFFGHDDEADKCRQQLDLLKSKCSK